MTEPGSTGPQPPLHFPAEGYPPVGPPAQFTQPRFPVNTGPLPAQSYPPTAGMPVVPPSPGSRRTTITLVVLILVFVAGTATMGTLYFLAQSHLNSTTQQLSATKSTLATVQGQLTQTKSDNQSLTTQKNALNNQIATMTPCANAAKALADLLDNDIKTNANPFLDANIVNPMSDEISACR